MVKENYPCDLLHTGAQGYKGSKKIRVELENVYENGDDNEDNGDDVDKDDDDNDNDEDDDDEPENDELTRQVVAAVGIC